MNLPAGATVREVGLRDGLQTLDQHLSTEEKLALAAAVVAGGIRRVEVTSFVRSEVIPQLADAAEVLAGVDRSTGVSWEALVPNLRGAERAVGAGADAVILVVAASETFNRRNVGRSVEDSLAALPGIARLAVGEGVRPLGVVATAFGDAYEGVVPPERVVEMARRFVDAGAVEVFLADTVGMANPRSVAALVPEVVAVVAPVPVGLHFHQTRGMGLANVLAGLEAGVTTFDASIGGLGGCPFAPVAAGNVATEDTAHLLEAMGVATGLDLDALIEAARLAERLLGVPLPGQVMKAGPALAHLP